MRSWRTICELIAENSLKEQPAGKWLQALFKSEELAVESVLREVCDRVLEEEESIVGRKVSSAATLQILGEAYVRVGTRKGGGGIATPGASGIIHYPRGSRMNLPTPRTSGTPDPNSSNHSTTNSSSGLEGNGTGLGNRDISSGLECAVGGYTDQNLAQFAMHRERILSFPPGLSAKDKAFSLFFSKVVTNAKEDDQSLQPFATAIYTELQSRHDSKIWRRFLNDPWSANTFTEQQWLFICHPLFHINLLHLLRDEQHKLLSLGTEGHELAQVPPSGVDRSGILSFPNDFKEFSEKLTQVFAGSAQGFLDTLQCLEPHYNAQRWLHPAHACFSISPLYCFKTSALFKDSPKRIHFWEVAKAIGPCRPDTLVDLERKWMKLLIEAADRKKTALNIFKEFMGSHAQSFEQISNKDLKFFFICDYLPNLKPKIASN
ncbi:hypothetical protein GG344DRAFT_71010 [Lentinula edodes]|nr:hypothetical protein GG344DRAFT_71010 [Lentinula edodes]